jgi:hypothetical protein
MLGRSAYQLKLRFATFLAVLEVERGLKKKRGRVTAGTSYVLLHVLGAGVL